MNLELERFKRDISLVSYAQTLGFSIVKSESTKRSVKMKIPGQTIIISTSHDNHGIYFNASSNKSGTIIDFIQEQKRINLGEVRKELRAWLGSNNYQENSQYQQSTYNHNYYKPEKSTPNEQLVAHNYAKTKSSYLNTYLSKRGIRIEIQTLDKFKEKIRIDERNNLIFPHFNNSGICGYEIKNTTFKGFSSGGEKGLWVSNNIKTADKIVIVEGVIDALSYEQLKGDTNTAYISTAGQLNEKQLTLLQEISNKYLAELISGLDNDEAGYKLHQIIEKSLAKTITRDVPKHKDWNEDLQKLLQGKQKHKETITNSISYCPKTLNKSQKIQEFNR